MWKLNRRASFIALCLVFTTWTVYGDETSSVKCRIVSDHTDKEVVWLGVFVGPMYPASEAWSWTSAESSEFSLEFPRTEEGILIVAFRKNSVPITTQLTPESRDSEITLDFESGNVLSGTLRSSDGIVVPNAVLSVERRDGPKLRLPEQARTKWTTDANGAFSIGGLVDGRYEIHVAPTHIPAESFNIQIMDGEDNRRDLILADAYHVLGRVVDHMGQVASGAVVNAFLDPTIWKDPSGNVVLGAAMQEAMRTFGRVDAHPSNDLTTTSDSTGSFQLGPFVYGQGLEISATRKDSGSTSRSKVFAGNHEVNLVLSKTIEVLGTVLDAATGAPVEQFTLEVRGPSTREFLYSSVNGRFSERIDSAVSSVVIHATAYLPHVKTNLDLKSLDEFNLGIVALEPGTQVAGRVFDLQNRRPVKGATIASVGRDIEGESPPDRSIIASRYGLGIAKTTSDAEGRFSLKPVPIEKVLLYVEAYGYKGEELVVEPQASPIDIGLTLRDMQNTRIVGRIQTTTGESVVGAVTIQEMDTGLITSRRSTSDGSFENFAHEGPHKLRAVSNRGTSKIVEVNVLDGKTEEIVLIVNASGRLRGTIDGLKRAENPFVMVLSGNRVVQATGNVLGGEFVLEGMGTGSFTVRVRTSMNRQLERSFELTNTMNEAYVEISFDGDSRLYGKVMYLVDTDSNLQVRAIAKDKESTVGWSDILDDGSFEILGLTDGEYWIEVGDETTWRGVDSDSNSQRIEAAVAGDTKLNIRSAAHSVNE